MTALDLALFVLRVALAVVMWPHGAQKVLGLFGGHGIAGTVGMFQTHLGLPAVVAYLVMAAEFLGPIGLVTGILARFSAAAIALDMIGALVVVDHRDGWFIHQGNGIEFFVFPIGVGIALALAGPGRLALLRRT